MHRNDKNLTENYTIPVFSEINTKQSFDEGNSSLFTNSILKKDKKEGRNHKSEKSQDYS